MRLHVVKLLASALSANDAALTQELLALDVPNTMLVRGMGRVYRWMGGWLKGEVGDGLGTGEGWRRLWPGAGNRASHCSCALQDLFFHYVFNNFLHAQVEVCVSAMLSSRPPSDSSPETPASNPVVKHVSWGSPSVLVGELCRRPDPHLSHSHSFWTIHRLGACPCSWGVSGRNRGCLVGN